MPLDPDFRKSYRAIARALEVDEGTIRHRVKRFRETGFIGEWHLMVNPTVWGGGHAIVWIEVPAAVQKETLIEELQLVPGVYYLTRFVGPPLEVYVAYEDEPLVVTQGELIRKLARAEIVKLTKMPFRECGVALSTTDWRLVRSLIASPYKSYAALAKELGLSNRTVKRRLQRLSQGEALFVFPDLDPKALSGSVMACLYVTYDRGAEVDQRLAAEFDPYLWHTLRVLPIRPGDAVLCNYNLLLPNIALARELAETVRAMEGVREARTELVEEILVSGKPLEEMTQRVADSFLAGRR